MSLLDIRDLRKSYESPEGDCVLVIDVPRFEMAPGELVALQGSSGSGKTTFLNLIAGILKADSGRIVVEGTEVTALSEGRRDEYRARTISYVFQTFNLLQGYTAIENVLLGMMFGPGPDLAFAKTLLTRVGLSDRMTYRPSQLSVGQQQRVALARALANRPRLILADEPTGNLDHVRAAEALYASSRGLQGDRSSTPAGKPRPRCARGLRPRRGTLQGQPGRPTPQRVH